MLPPNRSTLRRNVRVLHFSDIRRVHNGHQVKHASTVLPLQSIKNQTGCSKPKRFRAILLALTRPSKFPEIWLVRYWLRTPSVALPMCQDTPIDFEVFATHPLIAEAITLPWPFVHLESFASSAPPITRLLS
jgi:hypothetical protein